MSGPVRTEGMWKMRLRTKGLITFAALVLYAVVVVLFLAHERERLLLATLALEEVYSEERALDRVAQAALHAKIRFEEMIRSGQITTSMVDDVQADVQHVQAGLVALGKYKTTATLQVQKLQDGIEVLRANRSRSELEALRARADYIESRMEHELRLVDSRHRALWSDYRSVYTRLTWLVLISGLFGAIAAGAVVALFFTRLTRDIDRLKARALSVVDGYRGEGLNIKRGDEVGDLGRAINQMQVELHRHEQQAEVMREQQFHREKMAALGSLAAVVAHEINNPVAAIEGIARAMCHEERLHPVRGENERVRPELIMRHTRAISVISRQLAEMTAPSPPDPGLTDLNGLIRQTCNFASYDPRLRGIRLVQDLDASLPAVWCVADHVNQVLLNLIINAADALEGVTDREPYIGVRTQCSDREIRLTVADNGRGMDETLRAHVFQEFFTTKPPERGRGIGLFLCKTLVERGGGRIEIESAPNAGTSVIIHLPTTVVQAAPSSYA